MPRANYLPKAMLFTLVLLNSLMQASAASPQTIEINPELHSLVLSSQVQVLRDDSGKMVYEEVSQPPLSNSFISSGVTGLNFGFTQAAYWYRFSLKNPHHSKQNNWILEISWPPLDYVDVYISDATGRLRIVRGGDLRPPGSTGINHRNYAIALDIEPGSEITLYIRAQLEGSHQLPLALWTAEAFYEKTNIENLLYGMFYGIVAVMIIYNFLIFLTIRDAAYLYYIIFIFWLAAAQMSLDGFAFPFMWWLSPAFVNKSLTVFIALSSLFIPLFIRTSLQTKKYSPRLDRMLGMAMAAAVLCAIMPIFLSVQISIFVVVMVAAITTVLIAAVILTQALTGHRTARFYVLVWGVLVVGIVAKVMQTNGLLPITFLTTYAIHIGLCFLVTLVSLGLADQINRERRQRERLAHRHELAETRAKIDFLAKMSHELRTPMNAIAGFTRLALGSSAENERLTHLGRIEKASESMLKVLDDVLNLTRIETGALHLINEPFSLSTVIDQVTSLVSAEAVNKGISMEVERAQDIPDLLVGDGPHLEQVLMNLIGNSVKFTDTGYVKFIIELVKANQNGISIRFTVQDTGIGITDEQRSRLFSPFSQGDQSLSRKYGGSGLGLVICKRLIELMGSQIDVQSEPGKGSEFSFTVDFGLADNAHQQLQGLSEGQAENTHAPELRGMHVLVVDDNGLNRRLAKEVLTDVGVKVELANDGQQAVEKVQSETFDAVLMDLQMPVMDGLQATRAIRQLEQFSNVPIIAMTANAMQQDRESALASGMNDFLPKPIDSTLLFELLARWAPSENGANMSDVSTKVDHGAISELPDELPGIELQEALLRLGGRKRLLLELLVEFAEDQKDASDRITVMWSSGKTEDAIREAHSLKGMAANIGCNQLSETARLLEMAMKSGEEDKLMPLLAEMERQLSQVRESVAALPNETPVATKADVLSEEAYSSQIAELMALVMSSDFTAQEKFDALKPTLAEKISPESLEKLSVAIRGFDFDTAADLLNECLS